MTGSIEIAEEEHAEWGPAMAALSEKRRAFVVALYDEDAPRKGDGLIIWAAQKAQYGTPTSSKKSLSVIGNRIVHDDRVQAAIVEHSQRCLRAIPPEAIRALKELIRDPKAKDHARGIAMVLDRADPLQTMHKVDVTHRNDGPPPLPLAEVLKRIEEIAARVGAALPPPKIIDAKAEEVQP